jgi:hypothetical protein
LARHGGRNAGLKQPGVARQERGSRGSLLSACAQVVPYRRIEVWTAGQREVANECSNRMFIKIRPASAFKRLGVSNG